MQVLSNFVDDVIEHLANRTTARERVSFHVAEAYEHREDPVPYGTLHLPETDIFGKDYRALPPAEHMVLVAWYENERQLDLTRSENGFTYVRLGRRHGALHVHPNLSMVRHLLLRTHDAKVPPGLIRLQEVGFRVFARKQLRTELEKHASGKGVAAWEGAAGKDDDEIIYALFRTQPDHAWDSCEWDGKRLMDLIEEFESDIRSRPVDNIGRTSPYPRIVPLRELLKAKL